MYAIRELEENQAFREPFRSYCMDVHGARIRIVSNSPQIIERFAEGYGFFRTDDEGSFHALYAFTEDEEGFPGDAKRYVAAGSRANVLMIPEYRRAYAYASAYDLTYAVGSFFTAMVEALLFDRFLIVHGAAVARPGRAGMIFAGALRCGKTTLTLNLIYGGYRFASDDVVLVDRDTLLVHPYPRMLNIRLESLALVPGLRRDTHRLKFSQTYVEPRYFLQKSESVADPFPCHAVFLLKRHAGRTRLEDITRADAAFGLLQQSFYPSTPSRPFRTTAENLPTLSKLLAGVATYRLVQGDSDPTGSLRAISRCEERAGNGARGSPP